MFVHISVPISIKNFFKSLFSLFSMLTFINIFLMVLELSCKGGGEFGVHYSHSKKLFYGRRILTLWNQRTPFMGFMQQLSVQDLRVFQFRPFIPLTTSSRQVATTIYAGSKRAIFAVINGRVNPYWGKISYKSSVPINLLTTYLGIYRSTTYQLLRYLVSTAD